MNHSIPHLPASYTLAHMKQLTGGNAMMMHRLLDTFLSSAGSNCELLESALAAKDSGQASEAAHKLTPQARHFGLEELSQNLKRIDKQAEVLKEAGEWESLISEVLPQMRAVIQAVKADIQEFS